MTTRPRVLIACEAAETVASLIDAEALGVDLHVATTPDAARSGPEPEIAFTVKPGGFGLDFHQWLVSRPGFRWLHVGGSGYDHVGDWTADRVTVSNCAGVLAPFLAQTCFGAIVAMNNHFFLYRDQQRRHEWTEHVFRPLTDQTLAIVGMGEIGRRLGAIARSAGIRVIGIRRTQGAMDEADEIRPPEELMDTLAEADIVSLHLRLDEDTHHLFGAEAFAAMKPGTLFLNTGRGGLVDEAALLEALESRLSGAYLDVFETEPLPAESPLWDHPKVFITPHASDGVDDWELRFGRLFADNLRRWQSGEPLVNPVRPPRP